jgi:hypothetical protein
MRVQSRREQEWLSTICARSMTGSTAPRWINKPGNQAGARGRGCNLTQGKTSTTCRESTAKRFFPE